MQSDSIQTFNRILDMLNSAFYRHTGQGSQGVSQMRAISNYKDDYNYKSGTEGLVSAQNDPDARHLEGMSEKVEASKQQVREGETIAQRFQAEQAAAKQNADAALRPFLDKAYADADKVAEQLDRVTQSENPRQLLNAMADARFGKRDHDAKINFARELYDLEEELLAKDVDINNGGQRIFAREVMKRHPEVFGDMKGEKGLFGNDAQRKEALKAIKDFEPNSDDILDLDEKLALATHNADVTQAQLGRMRQNAKHLADRADLSRMAQMEAQIAAELGEPVPQQAQDVAQEAELEEEQHEFAFDEEPAMEAAKPATAEADINVDDVYDIDDATTAAAGDADPTQDINLEAGLSMSAAPEDRIGGVAQAAAKPSLMSQMAKGLAGLRGRAEKFARSMGSEVSRRYQEVKDYRFSFRNDPAPEQEPLELTEDMQVQAQDRIAEMRAMFEDPEISPAGIRAHLDHEAEAYSKQKGVTFVDIEGPDGTKQSVPKQMVPLYEEVAEMEAFEAREPTTAAGQRSQLLAAEKEYYTENKRGKFAEVEVDGEKHMVRQETVSYMHELNDRAAEEQTSGVPQPMDVDIHELTPKGQAEKQQRDAEREAQKAKDAEQAASYARRRRRSRTRQQQPSPTIASPFITRFR